MLKYLRVNKFLWLIIAIVSLVVACIGILDQDVYGDVIRADLLAGVVAQDLITIFSGIALLVLVVITRETDVKKQIIAFGLLTYVWYAYGIYVIERVYNPLYLLYMTIFGLTFWSIVYGMIAVKQDVVRRLDMPARIRNLSALCLIGTAALFYVMWTAKLVPIMRTGEKIEFLYAIFILDMALVLPALIIAGVLLIKHRAWGVMLAPVLFLKAFTLLFSVGLGELIKPFYGQTADRGEMALYFTLSAVYLIFVVINISTIRVRASNDI